jgi:hypothetical protein
MGLRNPAVEHKKAMWNGYEHTEYENNRVARLRYILDLTPPHQIEIARNMQDRSKAKRIY